MENLEILKKVLKPETFALVEEETKDSKIKLADLSSGKYVDEGKYSTLKEQLDKTQELFTKKSEEYDNLVKTAGDNEELKKQLEEAKTNYETEITQIQNEANAKLKTEKVKSAILNTYKPKDIADIMPYVDFEKISEDNGNLIGIEEQIKPLTENKAYLFNVEEKASTGIEHQHESTPTDAFLQGFDE